MEKQFDEIPMTESRRRLLDSHLLTWVNELNLDAVLLELLSANVINSSIIDIIKCESTASLRSYQFIRQLKMRGNNAFFHFHQALIRCDQRQLAALIEGDLSIDERSRCVISMNANSEIEAKLIDDRVLLDETHENISQAAIQQNKEYYKHFDSIIVKQPKGILHDLSVDCIDNNGPDFVNYDKKLMYRNFSSPRGLAMIINNRFFRGMPERIGTDVDEMNLTNLLRQLGYTVLVRRNLSAKDMLACISSFSQRKEHLFFDSTINVVLTHGEDGQLFGVDDIPLSVYDFVSFLNAKNCPALAHKPKIFFIQACRGQLYDSGFNSKVGNDHQDGFFDNLFICTTPQERVCDVRASTAKLPIEADILISYATTPGYVSWRNSLKGSWFVQSICEVFAANAKQMDLLSMLTMCIGFGGCGLGGCCYGGFGRFCARAKGSKTFSVKEADDRSLTEYKVDNEDLDQIALISTPNEEFLKCCKVNVLPDKCLSKCSFTEYNKNNLIEMYLGISECPLKAANHIHFCASKGNDHRKCCINNGVHTTTAAEKCLIFCDKPSHNEKRLDISYLPCFERFDAIRTCFWQSTLMDYLEKVKTVSENFDYSF